MTLKRPVLTYACKTWTLSLGDLTNAIDPIPYYSPNELPHMSASGTLDLPASHVRSDQARSDSTQFPRVVSTARKRQNTDDNKTHNEAQWVDPLPISLELSHFPIFSTFRTTTFFTEIFFRITFSGNRSIGLDDRRYRGLVWNTKPGRLQNLERHHLHQWDFIPWPSYRG